VVESTEEQVRGFLVCPWEGKAVRAQHVLRGARSLGASADVATLMDSQASEASATLHITPSVRAGGFGPEIHTRLDVVSLVAL